MEYISQSFIKDVFDYKIGEKCGLQIQARYYDNIEFPPSEVQLLGQWFEYKATGQKTKFGHIPEPKRNKPKKEGELGALSKKFSDILEHIPHFNKMIEEYGMEIVSTGKRILKEGISGDVDVEVKYKDTGKKAFVDIKTSGLIDNRWDDYGWADDALEYKDRTMIQAVQYKLLGIYEYGYEPDFYFFVFSNTNTTDRKAFKIVLNETRIDEHKRTIETVRGIAKHHEEAGWEAIPSVKECAKCPLKGKCKDFIDIPIVKTVYY